MRSILCVCQHVGLEIVLLGEGLAAHLAPEALVVLGLVPLETRSRGEAFVACVAGVGFTQAVCV